MAKIQVTCPNCSARYRIEEGLAGRRGRCAKCGARFEMASTADRGQEAEASTPDATEERLGEEDVPEEWQPGDVILDLYEVKEVLGQGGFGRVYRVHHRGWNVDLAVKSPLPGRFRTEREKERFVQECQTWVDLGLHPHTVSCHYVRILGGIPRVFAEYVEGGSLQDWIDQGRLVRFPSGTAAGREGPSLLSSCNRSAEGRTGTPRDGEKGVEGRLTQCGDEELVPGESTTLYAGQAWGASQLTPLCAGGRAAGGEEAKLSSRPGLKGILDIAIQIAWGMSFAHSRGLIHRDLKPANVLMTPDGTAKVTDFGLARQGATPTENTADGPRNLAVLVSAAAGTPGYAAPEQVSVGSTVDHRADIFAFGVLLWRMLGGRITWAKELRKSVIAKRAVTALLTRGDAPSLPSRMRRIIVRCLEPEPEDRWDDFTALLEPLKQIYAETTAEAYPRGEPRPADAVAEALNNRALTMLDLGKTDEAVQSWEQALAADAKHLGSVYNYGLFLWRQAQIHDVELAARVREAGVGAEPWRAALLAAQVELERDDCQAAIAILEAVEGPDAERRQVQTLLARVRSLEPTSRRCLRVLEGHTDAVNSVYLSADGRYGLTGSSDTMLKLWEIGMGQCVRTFEGHTQSVRSVCLSADNTRALSGSSDETLKLWEVATGECLRTFKGHGRRDWLFWGEGHGAANSVCFSSDGRRALSGSSDRTLMLWEVATGEPLILPKSEPRGDVIPVAGLPPYRPGGHDDRVACVCLSSDHRHALSGSGDNSLKFWNLDKETCVRTFEGHAGAVNSVCLSFDGTHALSGSSDKTLKLWDVESGRCLRTFTGHTDEVNGVCFGADGHCALSASSDRTLKLWDVETGRCLRTFIEHTARVFSACLGFAGRWVLSGSEDRTARLWDMAGNVAVRAPWEVSQPSDGGASSEVSARFAEDLASARGALTSGEASCAASLLRHARGLRGYRRHPEAVALWRDLYRRLPRTSFADGWQERCLKGHAGAVNAVCLCSEGGYALSGSSDKTLRLWEMESGHCVRTFQGHTRAVHAVAFSLDGRYTLSGSADATAKVWETGAGGCVRTLHGHTAAVQSVVLSADGRYALSGSADKTAKLWDLASGRCLRTFRGHTADVNSVWLSLDGRNALSGSTDGTVRLWDVRTRKCLRTFEGHASVVTSVCLDLQGRHVLSASWDKTLKLWDVGRAHCLRTFEGHTGAVNSVCLGFDGRYGLSGSSDGTMSLWELSTGSCLRAFQGHAGLVSSVGLALDGRWAISGGEDKTLKLYTLDWKLGEKSIVDWDAAAQPYLKVFLMQQTPRMVSLPSARKPTRKEITRSLTPRGKPAWTRGDFERLRFTLACSGFGWLRSEGVRRELEKLAATWAGFSLEVCVQYSRHEAKIRTVGHRVERIEVNGIRFALIPAGTFLMGSHYPDDCGKRDEDPQHRVHITRPFYLGVYPVTQSQYEGLTGTNPSEFTGVGNRPVETVSWEDATAFCRKLTEKLRDEVDGFVCRLPTEAEWEYACRAGTTTRYFFGDHASQIRKYAWTDKHPKYAWCVAIRDMLDTICFRPPTHPVGRKKPNAWGLYDMLGNVCEWCQDWYDDAYYAISPIEDPSGVAQSSQRVVRGGSGLDHAEICRSAYRWAVNPFCRSSTIGFRVALVPSGK